MIDPLITVNDCKSQHLKQVFLTTTPNETNEVVQCCE